MKLVEITWEHDLRPAAPAKVTLTLEGTTEELYAWLHERFGDSTPRPPALAPPIEPAQLTAGPAVLEAEFADE